MYLLSRGSDALQNLIKGRAVVIHELKQVCAAHCAPYSYEWSPARTSGRASLLTHRDVTWGGDPVLASLPRPFQSPLLNVAAQGSLEDIIPPSLTARHQLTHSPSSARPRRRVLGRGRGHRAHGAPARAATDDRGERMLLRPCAGHERRARTRPRRTRTRLWVPTDGAQWGGAIGRAVWR